jgi:putative phosphoesterase
MAPSKKRPKKTFKPLSGRIDRYEYALPTTIGVLSDTHIFGGAGSRQLPEDVLDLIRRFEVDLIVHGGDIVIQPVLDRLATVAPTIAVHGNNEPLELWKALPERIVLSIGPHRIGVVHGHGGTTARSTAKTAFDEPVELVIYGHSHIPMIEEVEGVTYFNPGSPTDRRWSRHFGIGIITIDERGIRPELILFDAPAHLASIEPQTAPGADE